MSGLYPLYAIWIAGLIAEVTGQHAIAVRLAGLTVVGFFFFFFSRSRTVFHKKTRELQEGRTVQEAHQATRGAAEGATTVIGEGVVMDGNITGGRDADIYGHVTGDIILPEGTVRILPEGYVNGNITATGIIISGVVEGCCEGHSVSVLAQGRFSGVCRSAAFSITTGGVFTGASEPWPEKTEPVCLQAGEKAPSPDRRDSPVADVRERAETKEEEQ
ncbi:polymer-forming cytoskeletal protein [Salmonella enterica subsp. enterica serovar Bredeney]|nr:polymer-forming cytoskeletal protein [Salmonella enterica subsp. enterica serovar Bredeney]MJU56287.1 polymer-forming cytoskeletal protein [Salmonella enterica subsp. enterica serovar Montevideo]